MERDTRRTDQLDRLAADPVAPPSDPSAEPTDANPVPLSPTDPKHRTGDGDKGATNNPVIAAIPVGQGTGGSGTAGQPAVPVVGETARPTNTQEDPTPEQERG